MDIRVVDSAGRYLGSFGRRGNGPNEFRSMVLAPGPRDTSFVFDPALERVTTIAPDGHLVANVRTSGLRAALDELSHEGLVARPIGGGAGGAILFAAEPLLVVATQSAMFRDTIFIVAYTPVSGKVSLVAQLPGLEWEPIGPGSHRARPALYGRHTLIAVADGELIVADNRGWEIAIDDLQGHPRRVIRAAIPAIALASDVVNADRRRLVEALDTSEDMSPTRRNAERQEIDKRSYPASLPPIAGLWADDSGYLYVQSTPLLGAALSDILVVAPSGEFVARLEIPPGLVPLAINRHRLLGTVTDVDGFEHVLSYHIANSHR